VLKLVPAHLVPWLCQSRANVCMAAALPRRAPPSAHVRRIAQDLLDLPPDELKQLRELCRDRLTPKPTSTSAKLPKDYNPSLKVKRSDRPFPLRSQLGHIGQRVSTLHPAWVFAGSGPGILPVSMPPLGAAIFGPHMAEMMAAATSMEGQHDPAISSALPVSPPATQVEETADAGAEESPTKETPAEPLKANVSLRLMSFEPAKKIAVIKEVRALLGEGLKESKDLVERAPTTLKKGVPRADAEAMAELFKAAGAQVELE